MLKIRLVAIIFMISLIISGITAIPLEKEAKIATQILGVDINLPTENYSGMQKWIAFAYQGIMSTNTKYPFIAYGSDWLAFAHIVIAFAFIGLYREPVRNKWLVSWAMICCVSVIPFAMICGEIRQIPFFWRLIDCSFGIFGLIPLIYLKYLISKAEKMNDYLEGKERELKI